MPTKRHIVRLPFGERDVLIDLVDRVHTAAARRRHAQILLLTDQGAHGPALSDVEVAKRVNVSPGTVGRIRRYYLDGGLTHAITRKGRCRERGPRLDARGEARLVALARSPAPEGRTRWTLRLLAERLVELGIVASISHETVRQILGRRRAPSTS